MSFRSIQKPLLPTFFFYSHNENNFFFIENYQISNFKQNLTFLYMYFDLLIFQCFPITFYLEFYINIHTSLTYFNLIKIHRKNFSEL